MEDNSNSSDSSQVDAAKTGAKRCIFCGVTMDPAATVCKTCGFDPSSWSPSDPQGKSAKLFSPFTLFLGVVFIILFGICVYRFILVN